MEEPCIHAYRIRESDRMLIGLQAPPAPIYSSIMEGIDGIYFDARHELYCLVEKGDTVKWLLSYFRSRIWLDLSHLRKYPEGEAAVRYAMVTRRALREDKQKVLAEVMTKLRVQRYSAKTIGNYKVAMESFLRYFNDVELAKLDEMDVMAYNKEMILDRNKSASTQRQFTGAIKHLFAHVQGASIDMEQLVYARRSRHLPVVLSKEEVTRMIQSARNDKHRLILLVLYAQGLRRGELIELKRSDLDMDREMIHVRDAKGGRDRSVPMSKVLKQVLISYLQSYRPVEHLIEGQGGGAYSGTSIGKVVSRAARVAGINKRVTPHTLRHSYATHCLELGLGLRYIQDFLGHRSPKTTMIYTHIRNDKTSINPLDELTKGLMDENSYTHFIQKSVLLAPD